MQAGKRTRFNDETLARDPSQVRRTEELNRNAAIKDHIVSEENLAHGASSKLTNDAVFRKFARRRPGYRFPPFQSLSMLAQALVCKQCTVG